MIGKWHHLLLGIGCLLLLTSCSRSSHEAQGYVEGRYTYMATPVSGVLERLLVERGTMVKAGTLLFSLELQPESDMARAAVENLEESIAARKGILANLEFSKLTYERYKILVPKNAIQQSQLDNAKSIYSANLAQLTSTDANIASLKATLAQSNWTLNQKQVRAPRDALVFDVYYRLGEYTIARQAVLSLLAPEDIKAIFFVPEADLGKIRLGAEVHVRCDSCETLTGKISFISPTAEYTPPVIFSNQTSAKLIFRIEAKFKVEDAMKMHPGQPVLVTYLP